MTNQAGLSRRGFLLRSSIATGGLIAGPALFSACSKADTGSGSRLDSLKSEGKITVGIAGEQPYAFLDHGDLTGEDPTVQKAIWNAVGIDNVEAKQVRIRLVDPRPQCRRLRRDRGGHVHQPRPCEQAAFSEPVYCAPNAFMVPTGQPGQHHRLRVGRRGRDQAGCLQRRRRGRASRGMPACPTATSSPCPTWRRGATQLEQGRIGAIGLTSITLNWHLEQNPDTDAEVTEAVHPMVDGKEVLGCGAAVFRKDDTDLVEAFNKELKKLKDSGELTKMIEEFGFGPETLPPDDVTTARACARAERDRPWRVSNASSSAPGWTWCSMGSGSRCTQRCSGPCSPSWSRSCSACSPCTGPRGLRGYRPRHRGVLPRHVAGRPAVLDRVRGCRCCRLQDRRQRGRTRSSPWV